MELNQFRDIYNDVTWTGANNKCKTTFYIPNMWVLHRKASIKFSITSLQAQVPEKIPPFTIRPRKHDNISHANF